MDQTAMTLEGRRFPLPELALVGICAVWGLTFPLVQDAVSEIPVMTFLGYRFTAAAIVVAVVFRRDAVSMRGRAVRSGILMGIFLTGGYVFQTFGLTRTSASNAGFITGLFVVLTPVFGWLLVRHRIKREAALAAAVSFLGLFLLSSFPGTSDAGREPTVFGDLLVFLCACSFSFHILVSDKPVKEHPLGGLLVVQLGLCGLGCLGVAGAMGDLVVPESTDVYLALVVTALFASALGFFVQAYAQTHASPARTALILASEPAFAGLFAYLLKGELLSPLGWLGAGLILGAIVTVEAVPYLRLPRPLPES